jgi:hypothetical protein
MKNMLALSTLGMLCWIVMFLSGTDVWHFAGSPDFWQLSGPPYTDLRAFGYAFYLQFLVLLVMIGFTVWTSLREVRSSKPAFDVD